MNSGKLNVLKQEMTRVNTVTLEISKLEWVNLIQMNIISNTVCKNLSEEWSNPHSQQKSEMQYLGKITKMTE